MGCYEPAHHVVEAVGPWLAKRLTTARWAIFTPDRSVRWEDGRLLFGPGVPHAELPRADADEGEWRDLYERVFAAHHA